MAGFPVQLQLSSILHTMVGLLDCPASPPTGSSSTTTLCQLHAFMSMILPALHDVFFSLVLPFACWEFPGTPRGLVQQQVSAVLHTATSAMNMLLLHSTTSICGLRFLLAGCMQITPRLLSCPAPHVPFPMRSSSTTLCQLRALHVLACVLLACWVFQYKDLYPDSRLLCLMCSTCITLSHLLPFVLLCSFLAGFLCACRITLACEQDIQCLCRAADFGATR